MRGSRQRFAIWHVSGGDCGDKGRRLILVGVLAGCHWASLVAAVGGKPLSFVGSC